MKLTVKIIPTKFLDTNSSCAHRIYKNMIHKKTTKLEMLWSSKVPKRWKHNSLYGDLQKVK